MAEDSGPRINVSVEVLEERLKNWANDVKIGQDRVLQELRRLSDRYDNQIGGIELWRAQHEIQFGYVTTDVANLKSAVEQINSIINKGKIVSDAKISLLKTQWTWLIAGVFAASLFIGVLTQLGLIHAFPASIFIDVIAQLRISYVG